MRKQEAYFITVNEYNLRKKHIEPTLFEDKVYQLFHNFGKLGMIQKEETIRPHYHIYFEPVRCWNPKQRKPIHKFISLLKLGTIPLRFELVKTKHYAMKYTKKDEGRIFRTFYPNQETYDDAIDWYTSVYENRRAMTQ